MNREDENEDEVVVIVVVVECSRAFSYLAGGAEEWSGKRETQIELVPEKMVE